MMCDLVDRGLEADRHQAEAFGSVRGATVARALLAAAELSAIHDDAIEGRWLDDPVDFSQAVEAMQRVLEGLRPISERGKAAPDAYRKRLETTLREAQQTLHSMRRNSEDGAGALEQHEREDGDPKPKNRL
jgi:hypothetical protein